MSVIRPPRRLDLQPRRCTTMREHVLPLSSIERGDKANPYPADPREQAVQVRVDPVPPEGLLMSDKEKNATRGGTQAISPHGDLPQRATGDPSEPVIDGLIAELEMALWGKDGNTWGTERLAAVRCVLLRAAAAGAKSAYERDEITIGGLSAWAERWKSQVLIARSALVAINSLSYQLEPLASRHPHFGAIRDWCLRGLGYEGHSAKCLSNGVLRCVCGQSPAKAEGR